MASKEITSQESEIHTIRIIQGFGDSIDMLAAKLTLKLGKKVSRNYIVTEYLVEGLNSGKLEKFVSEHHKVTL